MAEEAINPKENPSSATCLDKLVISYCMLNIYPYFIESVPLTIKEVSFCNRWRLSQSSKTGHTQRISTCEMPNPKWHIYHGISTPKAHRI